jgi:hypothetical protein
LPGQALGVGRAGFDQAQILGQRRGLAHGLDPRGLPLGVFVAVLGQELPERFGMLALELFEARPAAKDRQEQAVLRRGGAPNQELREIQFQRALQLLKQGFAVIDQLSAEFGHLVQPPCLFVAGGEGDEFVVLVFEKLRQEFGVFGIGLGSRRINRLPIAGQLLGIDGIQFEALAPQQRVHHRALALLQGDQNPLAQSLAFHLGDPFRDGFGGVLDRRVFARAVGPDEAQGMLAVAPIEADENAGHGVGGGFHDGSSPGKVNLDLTGHAALGAGENLIARDVLAPSSGVIRWFPKASSRSKVWAHSFERTGKRFVAGRCVPFVPSCKIPGEKENQKIRRRIGSGAGEAGGRNSGPSLLSRDRS